MAILQLNNVVKEYKDKRAVDSVSFSIPEGKIFGLLGPNGAGKTSIIRMITNITRPDAGSILFRGEELRREHIEQIGYLPEERGLYKKMKVGEQLLYLARIKGMNKQEARSALKAEAEKFEIESWWDKKIEELSKGMQQKIQFIATTIHNPRLLILDEPFTGLDPINTNLIKSEIRKKVDNGCTVIFSTHRMEQVEEVCENIVLINQGQNILEGSVERVKEDNKEHKYEVRSREALRVSLDQDIIKTEPTDDGAIVYTRADLSPDKALRILLDQGNAISSFQEVLPSLDEIFIKTVQQKQEA